MKNDAFKPGRREIGWMIGVLAILSVVVLFVEWFKMDAQRVETYYSQGMYPYTAGIVQAVFRWIPVSLGDLFYAAVVLLGGYWFVRGLKGLCRSAWAFAGRFLLRVVNLGLFLYVVFYLSWGLNYYRKPLDDRLGLSDIQTGISDYIEVTIRYIDSVNVLRNKIGIHDDELSDRVIFEEASRILIADTALNKQLYVYRPNAKVPLINAFGNYMGVAGYFNPYTHEAHVNKDMPVWNKPFTACHELAHQAGVGFEDEANYVGFVISRQSEDVLFRYSAYYNALWYLLDDINLYDPILYVQLYERIHPDVIADAAAHRAFWQYYLGLVNSVTDAFYGKYLEANNQPEGMKRYNRMVHLLVASYVDENDCLSVE